MIDLAMVPLSFSNSMQQICKVPSSARLGGDGILVGEVYPDGIPAHGYPDQGYGKHIVLKHRDFRIGI